MRDSDLPIFPREFNVKTIVVGASFSRLMVAALTVGQLIHLYKSSYLHRWVTKANEFCQKFQLHLETRFSLLVSTPMIVKVLVA